jgi:P27 family predicted phage terminase small subunit
LADSVEKNFYNASKVVQSHPPTEPSMSGPPPIPPKIVALRGNPGKRKLRSAVEPPMSPQPPEPPACLTGYALDEWYRLAPQLHERGLLSVLDVASFAAYCEAYKVWREASEMLARTPEDEQIVVDGKPNPLIRIARNAASQMTTIGAQFGLSPSARARVTGITSPKGPSKFAGLVAFDDD